MRRIAWGLLLLLAFAIPWEYSLDLGEPFGNIARVLGLVLLSVAIPAVLQAGRLRTPGAMQWLVLALFLWFCCSYLWTIEPAATLEKLRGYIQEMTIVWLVWEFAESPADLRALMRAYLAGAGVLALLTLVNFRSLEAIAVDQIRFAANGQDPNDVARFLDLGFPLAALLVNSERRWPWRLLALGYLPLGLLAVVLTASRGGFLSALIALAGCGWLLIRSHAKAVLAGALGLPALATLWFIVPHETFQRLATIPAQLQGGDLNQRINIWSAGWHAFVQSPIMGTGAGTFVSAAGLSPLDTAHNSELSILVAGGLCAFFLAVGIAVTAARSALLTRGPLLVALIATQLVLAVSSQIDTVEENRATWLLLGLIAIAGRLAVEQPDQLDECFPVESSPVEAGVIPAICCRPAN
jgi:O-antigen ligase